MKTIVLASFLALCPGKQIVQTRNSIEADLGGPQIHINMREFRAIPSRLRSFVILHECGHTKGLGEELQADAYALERWKFKKGDAKGLCKLLEGDINERSRCKQIVNYRGAK